MQNQSSGEEKVKSSIEQKSIRQISSKLERAIGVVDQGARFVDLYDTLESDVERENCGLLVGLAVHDSWFTITQIMKRVAADLDRDVPKGKGSADRLIELMTARTDKRPQVISPKLAGKALSIQSFHKQFRRASLPRRPPHELIDCFEAISDEILPDIVKNLNALLEPFYERSAKSEGQAALIAASAVPERKVVSFQPI
jgi:hypothetical protein